jgi:hypothetical protein
VIRFFAGLSVINLFVFFLDNEVPLFTLFGFGNKYNNYWVSLFMHLVFLISFVVASIPDIRALSMKEEDYNRQQ